MGHYDDCLEAHEEMEREIAALARRHGISPYYAKQVWSGVGEIHEGKFRIRRKRVLVLCHGNINRSPLCHAVLALHGIPVRSAGFVNPGRRASKKMRDAAAALGIDLSEHRSQVITPEMYEWAELVVYMDGGNRDRLQEFAFPLPLARESVCLARFAETPTARIPDPAFIKRDTPEFTAVVQLIKSCSETLAKKLIAGD